MLVADSDAFYVNQGTSLRVEGTAQGQNETKHFAWSFRGAYSYSGCKALPGTRVQKGLDFQANVAQTVDVLIRSATIFQDSTDDRVATTWFQPFADADDIFGNADGEVTLDEMQHVALVQANSNASQPKFLSVGNKSVTTDAGIWSEPSTVPEGAVTDIYTTLDVFLYFELASHVPHFRDTGTCDVAADNSGRRPGPF
jgi:hypothetical protein